jgi:hypothetical protein
MNGMADYKSAFDWVDFDQGRARFSGSIRGYDEVGHDTFEIEIDSEAHFGEIRDVWIDSHEFDLEIVRFGYFNRDDVGIPAEPGNLAIAVFSPDRIAIAQGLICALIASFAESDRKPAFMSETKNSKFTGKVRFREGWAFTGDGEEGAVK